MKYPENATIRDRLLYFTPRVASFVFVVFISIFAFDVFEQYSGWELALAFFMHLIPSLALLVLAFVAWRYALVGAIAFLGFAVWYIWWAGIGRPWSWYASIALPAAFVGILYFLSWLRSRKQK